MFIPIICMVFYVSYIGKINIDRENILSVGCTTHRTKNRRKKKYRVYIIVTTYSYLKCVFERIQFHVHTT